MTLTPYERDRLRARRKVDRLDAKDSAKIPLFADQLEPRDEDAEYWKMRKTWALREGGGAEAGYLSGVAWRVDKWILRNVVRRFMSAKDFAIAEAAQHNHGDVIAFWKNIVTGRQRVVLSYWRHVYGCAESVPCPYWDGPPFIVEKHVEIGEALVWPPEGWEAPLTKEELETLIAIPPAIEHPGAFDPGWDRATLII